jgi:hypothetical protein
MTEPLRRAVTAATLVRWAQAARGITWGRPLAAFEAVIHVLTVALVTGFARVQHAIGRSKHLAQPAVAAVAASTLLGLNGWLWLIGPDKYIW